MLKQGLDVLDASHPGSPEVGELHNQAALLLYFQARCDEAARHAATSLDITRAAFGTRNMLTAHRLVRLGTIKFGQGQVAEAAPLLQEGLEILQEESGEHDPGRAEAAFYLGLVTLASSGASGAIADVEPTLLDSLQRMKRVLGQESMIITLALTQHGRVVLALSSTNPDIRIVESLYKQHRRLQQSRDPGSEDTALAAYKLAVLYYSHDLLHDARKELQVATELLRSLYPEDHDMVVLCKHRMGMLAAAAGDHRAATQLLQMTGKQYREQDADHPLAAEADVGLAAARFRANSKDEALRKEQLEVMDKGIEGMAGGLGAEHLLVHAARRMQQQLAATLQR